MASAAIGNPLAAQVAGFFDCSDYTSPGRRPRPIHGNVTFPASTRRRSKMCRDPFAASSMTAQSLYSSTSQPPLMAHNRPAPPGCARGRVRWQPNRVAAFQPNSAARPAQFSPPVKKLLQSLKNCRHRCGAMSVSGRWWSRRATQHIAPGELFSLLPFAFPAIPFERPGCESLPPATRLNFIGRVVIGGPR